MKLTPEDFFGPRDEVGRRGGGPPRSSDPEDPIPFLRSIFGRFRTPAVLRIGPSFGSVIFPLFGEDISASVLLPRRFGDPPWFLDLRVGDTEPSPKSVCLFVSLPVKKFFFCPFSNGS